MQMNMKKTWVLLILACTTFVLQAQRKPKIKGNRSVIEVSERLTAFNSIEVIDDLDITLRRASDPGYSITADDNLIDVLKIRVADSTLVISSFYQITAKKKLEITIDYEHLKSITLRDGEVKSIDKISSEELVIHTLGSSKTDLSVDANTVHIQMEDNSSGRFNVMTDSLQIRLNKKADASIYTDAYKNYLEMEGNSSLSLEGTSDLFSIQLTDNANLKAQDLDAREVTAILEASSNARVFSSTSLELSQSGSSRCYLYGDPKINIVQFLDTSELFKRKK